MFGESDSESPRVPSPWDSLSSAPPSPRQIPKLVPEAEEGNVEYKLQLLSPSPARFARLVTQLKWRLLEGGGQAYYELGVADSGTLVGLPRQQLEQSLETLEMMAGEIGASVIVVKEIEVPPALSSLAESQLERWGGKCSTSRKDLLRMRKQEDDASLIEGLSNTDAEESTSDSPVTPLSSPAVRSTATLPLDSALAIFTADGEEDIASYADNEAQDDDLVSFSVGLEIASVYKPRPMKKRWTHIQFEYAKKRRKNGYLSGATLHSTNRATPESLPQPGKAKLQHRSKPDKRREMKLNSLPTDGLALPLPIICSDDRLSSSAGDLVPNSVIDDSLVVEASRTTSLACNEPRLIVEALVVRKMSLDEAFLDFEGFSLQ